MNRTLKEVLGFDEGYITIFKGSIAPVEDWFKESVCRFHVFFGWYLVSTETLTNPLPSGIEPVKLLWEDISISDNALKPEFEVKEHIASLLCAKSLSRHIGTIGERLDLFLTVKKAKTSVGRYGSSTFHLLEDAEGNEFIWNTTARTLAEGSSYPVRATIKNHIFYEGRRQTELLRLAIQE